MLTNRVKYCSKTKSVVAIQTNELPHCVKSHTNKNENCVMIPNSTSVAIKSNQTTQYRHFDHIFDSVIGEINALSITEKTKNTIYKILEQMLNSYSDLIIESWECQCDEQCGKTTKSKIIDMRSYVNNKISVVSTSYKRKKELKNKGYVEPIETAIGQKWKTKQNPLSGLPDYSITQTTFQYIPILRTLEHLFGQESFKQIFLEHNSDGHVCQAGLYERFCCSAVGKNCELFTNRKTIKIRLATDDFDVCDANKSKKTIHKINAVYFNIVNLPKKYSSKLDNIFLVSLCETMNLKSQDISFDSIALNIFNELKSSKLLG